MHILGVDMVQSCPFMGTATVTSCYNPKGKLLFNFLLFFSDTFSIHISEFTKCTFSYTYTAYENEWKFPSETGYTMRKKYRP